MSLRKLLMPLVMQHRLSERYLLRQRARAERRRLAAGSRHVVHYFHQVDDPYSALTAAVLPRLVERYDIELLSHVVGPPSDSAAPERARLTAYSRRDAEVLARRYGLQFDDIGGQPDEGAVQIAAAMLVAAVREHRFVELAGEVCASLWSGSMRPQSSAVATPTEVATHCSAAGNLRQELGHYLGATFHHGGEWYWGIDRLHYLERRLQDLGAARHATGAAMFPPPEDLSARVPIADPPPIDFFFSFRSPYSAIVARRVFDLGRLTGAEVRLRFVLPMVMRGLPVPRAKSIYIVSDTAREARSRGIPSVLAALALLIAFAIWLYRRRSAISEGRR